MPMSLFGRRWWWTTLLVIAAIGVMARLGVWQLDRLEQRRAFVARVQAQIDEPPLALTAAALDQPLADMEYRAVTVIGEYDHSQEVALRNQVWDGRLGVHLLTPLVIAGSDRAVLINRGWVPAGPADWEAYRQAGRVEVRGVIRRAQARPDFGGVPDPEGTLRLWNLVNVERIDEQVSFALLPIYVQQSPDPALSGPPHPTAPALDLSEGPHFGYAMQWFLFALVLGVGYPFFVRSNERARPAG